MVEGVVVGEGEDGVGTEVDMETTKKMVDIQTGAEVVGVAEVGGTVASMVTMVLALLGMKEEEAGEEGAEATAAAVEGWAAAVGVVVATRLNWYLVCFALARYLQCLSNYGNPKNLFWKRVNFMAYVHQGFFKH